MKVIQKISRIARLAILMSTGALVVACAATSPPATFYELRALRPATVPPTPPSLSSAVVGVGPVEITEVLDRPQLVTAQSGNVLGIAEYHRWGGSLRDTLPKVMATNLSWRLGNEQVFALPWTIATPLDYRIALNIYRFDGSPGGEARLDADWIILDDKAQSLIPIRKAMLVEPTTREGYAGLVEAFDRLLARLADRIAGQLRALQKGQATASDIP